MKHLLKYTLVLLAIIAAMCSCSKEDEEKENPEQSTGSPIYDVSDLENISGGFLNGSMYFPIVGTSYYSDDTWGNNPHSNDAEIIGVIAYLDNAEIKDDGTQIQRGIVMSLIDAYADTYYPWSQANSIASNYEAKGTQAGDWHLGNEDEWRKVTNALAETNVITWQTWQGGSKLYATINKRISDAGGVWLNGGYWINANGEPIIIFNALDGVTIRSTNNSGNRYLESVRPFLDVTLIY